MDEVSELPGATLPPGGPSLAVDGETAVAFGRTMKIEIAGTAAEVSDHGPEVRVGQAVEQGTRMAESTSVEPLPLAEAEEQRRRNELAEQNPIALDEPAAAEAPPPSVASAVSAATPAKRAGGQLEPRTVRPRGMAADKPDWTNRRVRVQFSDGWHRGTALERFEVTGGIEWRVCFDDGDDLRVPEKKMLPANEVAASGDKEKPAPVAPLSNDGEQPPPMPPPSRADRHVKVEHEEHSCCAKDEHEQEAKGGAKRVKDAYTLAREAMRRRLQFEPDGKTPRAVFRAGCAPRCLTKVLGGVGTDMLRFVKEDKVLADGHVLIKKGEMYLWGRSDWNTYAPSFAGDVGAYRNDILARLKKQQLAMGWDAPQSTFHLFRECTKRFLIDMPLSAYHGKDAETKTLYCGRYRVDDDVTYEQSFKELPSCTQECICEIAARREVGNRESAHAQRDRRALEIMAERLQANHVYTMHGVEFVDYDEKLYGALVDYGANNGRVEVDDVTLGPL